MTNKELLTNKVELFRRLDAIALNYDAYVILRSMIAPQDVLSLEDYINRYDFKYANFKENFEEWLKLRNF